MNSVLFANGSVIICGVLQKYIEVWFFVFVMDFRCIPLRNRESDCAAF